MYHQTNFLFQKSVYFQIMPLSGLSSHSGTNLMQIDYKKLNKNRNLRQFIALFGTTPGCLFGSLEYVTQ